MLRSLRGEDENARRQALIALEAGEASIDAEICHALIELLGNPSKEIRRRAAGALSHAAADHAHRAAIERALADEDPRRRWCAGFALARAGILDEAVTRCALEALGAADGDVRWAAAEIVCNAVRRHPELLQLILDCSRSNVAEQRKMALYCLRDLELGDEQPFVAALSDTDRTVRLAALAGLARFQQVDADALESLVTCLRHDPDIGVRRAAATCVARVASDDAGAAAALADAATSGDEDLARAAKRERGKST